MRWFDFLAAFIFIGVTVLLLGGTALAVKQRTTDRYLAEVVQNPGETVRQRIPLIH